MQDEPTENTAQTGVPTKDQPVLPGNHGQFGEGDATEAYDTLQDHPTPADAPKGPQQVNAGERS